MSNTPKNLSSGQLAASATTLYTCTAGKTVITSCTICNDTTTAVTATFYIVPSGDTAGVANMLVNAQALNDSESLTLNELVGQVLGAGDFISALASSATQVTATISGVEVT